ncbi:MAG: phosphotransferase [Pseudomonadota bacterium]
MSSAETLIPTATTISAEWLTERLRASVDPGATVTDFSAHNIGTGQVGQCLRIELELAGAQPDTPTRLIAKLPSSDPTSSATGVALRNYYREVMFYREIAPRLSIRLPHCYHADIDGEGPAFILLLEDLAPAQPGNQLEGCRPEIAEAAALELVGLHAPSWCDESLKGYDYLHAEPSPEAPQVGDMYRQLLPGFIDRYGPSLAADERRIIEAVAEAAEPPLFRPLSTPFSLEHVDYRLDNMMIDERTGTPRLTVLDWQSIRVGKPLNDVAYFIGAGMLPEVRRPVEEGIVRRYYDALCSAGVSNFEWADCWQRYREGTFAGFGITVIASMIVVQTERGDAMFTAMAQRHARHALDLGADAFLT